MTARLISVSGMQTPVTADLIRQFYACIRRDPAKRGLIGSEPLFGPLCPGHLAAAASDLAQSGTRVVLVTGFYIPAGDPSAAETDGPPGALVLAQTLHSLGIETEVITDGYCFSALAAAARCAGFPAERLVEYPCGPLRGAAQAATAGWRTPLLHATAGPAQSA